MQAVLYLHCSKMTQVWRDFMEASGYYNHSPWFPNPLICARDMAGRVVMEVVERLPWNGIGVWLEETRQMIERTVFLDVNSVLLVIALAFLFTALRAFLDLVLLRRIPEWFNLSENGRTKFPESAWKVIVYGSLWTMSLNVVVSKKWEYFFNLESHWKKWTPGFPIESSMYWILMLEIGFYLHSIYATIYLETRRKDYAVTLTHHFVTIGLEFFTYIIRIHNVGIMLLCLIDIGDFVLEFGKCVLYFKDRNGRQHYWPEQGANVIFGIFAAQFFMCRIYWIFTKILYSCTYVAPTWYGPGAPWYLLLTPMIWTIYLMQMYWFRLILLLLYRVFIKGEVINDNRDETNEHIKHN